MQNDSSDPTDLAKIGTGSDSYTQNTLPMDWKDAIIHVLQKSSDAMKCVEISDQIIKLGLRNKVGATPSNTINAVINSSINAEGTNSPFVRVSRGSYMLRSKIDGAPDSEGAAGEPTPVGEGETENAAILPDSTAVEGIPESGGVIQAFGMFWRADKVSWRTSGSKKTKLYGVQQAGADPVDFYDQIGIYMLHDRNKVIYIGRVTDRPLGLRLCEHTRDRHNGRWDRFSWFGFKKVNDDGKLEDVKQEHSISDIIVAMEAVLIEGLEPPQNRRRGDSIAEIEYLQEEDQDFKKDQMRKVLEQALKMTNSGDE